MSLYLQKKNSSCLLHQRSVLQWSQQSSPPSGWHCHLIRFHDVSRISIALLINKNNLKVSRRCNRPITDADNGRTTIVLTCLSHVSSKTRDQSCVCEAQHERRHCVIPSWWSVQIKRASSHQTFHLPPGAYLAHQAPCPQTTLIKHLRMHYWLSWNCKLVENDDVESASDTRHGNDGVLLDRCVSCRYCLVKNRDGYL